MRWLSLPLLAACTLSLGPLSLLGCGGDNSSEDNSSSSSGGNNATSGGGNNTSSGGGDNNTSSGGSGGGNTSSGGGGGNNTSSSGGGAAGEQHDIRQESVQDVANRRHEYVLVTPKQPAAGPLPILLVYHGNGEDGPRFQRQLQLEQVTGNAAIIAYMHKPGGWDVLQANANNPNVAGFDAVVAKLVAEHNGDAQKVSVLGWSNGGFFAHILGGVRSNRLHAIASMAGGYPSAEDQNTPLRWTPSIARYEGQGPVRALVIYGENDTTGGKEWPARVWEHINRCARSATPDNCPLAYGPTTPATREHCQDFSNVPADAPVRKCAIPGMGHRVWEQTNAAFWDFVNGR